MTANDNILRNDPAAIRFRRDSDTLVILGTGVMGFGVWGIVKLIAQFIVGEELFSAEDVETLGPVGMFITVAILIYLLTLEVLIRVYIGISAGKEGRGRKTGPAYLVITAILILSSVFSIWFVLDTLASIGGGLFETVTSLFLEITSLVISIELFVAGIRVRRYKAGKIKGSR